MAPYLAMAFTAPFALAGAAISAWLVWEIFTSPIVDPYDDENNWGA